MKKVVVIGTQGVPARYGGFESLVENIIGDNCSSDIEYTIICSSKDIKNKIRKYKGCILRYIPLHANGAQSILYDISSMIISLWRYDTILILGISGCLFLPIYRLLSRNKIIVNIDGLEHRREKWNKWIRLFLKKSEACAVKNADIIIADNRGIQEYVKETYSKYAELIAYGGDHVIRNILDDKQKAILNIYNLSANSYSISICRIEPENNCHIILKAFSQVDKKLVFIGNWNHSEYARKLRSEYQKYSNIQLLDAIYDLDLLFILRNNAEFYIHGHSAGGTNPSLVEAMFFGCPIIAYDVVYNRETTFNEAYYFNTPSDIINFLHFKGIDGHKMREFANEHYTWSKISKEYEALY